MGVWRVLKLYSLGSTIKMTGYLTKANFGNISSANNVCVVRDALDLNGFEIPNEVVPGHNVLPYLLRNSR